LRYASAGGLDREILVLGYECVAWNEKGKSWKGEPRQEDLGKEDTGGDWDRYRWNFNVYK